MSSSEGKKEHSKEWLERGKENEEIETKTNCSKKKIIHHLRRYLRQWGKKHTKLWILFNLYPKVPSWALLKRALISIMRRNCASAKKEQTGDRQGEKCKNRNAGQLVTVSIIWVLVSPQLRSRLLFQFKPLFLLAPTSWYPTLSPTYSRVMYSRTILHFHLDLRCLRASRCQRSRWICLSLWKQIPKSDTRNCTELQRGKEMCLTFKTH